MYQQKHFACLLILFISASGNVSGVDHKIPFPKALTDASIKVDNLNDMLDGALIIGNGDINALIYGGELRLLSPWQKIKACTDKNLDFLPLATDQKGVVSILTKAGETWLFKGF